MSTFDDASLVFIPSGYKTSKAYSVKPTDGSGDLAFTRSNDTATRVGPDGLIEKVRTNLILQSNTFSNASWTKSNATVTAGQTGYDGTSNAWLLSKSSGYGRVEQTLATTGLETFSVYVKAGDSNYTEITSNAGPYVAVNLTNGSIVAQSGVTPLVTSVGSGWYRISIAYTKAASNVWRIIAGDAGSSSSAAGSTGTIIIQAAQAEAGDIATDYIATTTAAVSVGPVANVPRLDYLGSTCPRLLLEPQRTNNALYSEQLDNAAWTKQNITVTANAVTSPSGYQDADKVVETVSTGAHRALVSSAATLNGTFSFFAKAGERTKVAILSTTIDLGFDLSNGTLIDLGTGTSAGKIENYGNGWYRCSLPQASGIVALYLALLDNANNISYTGNGTSGAYFWGAQLEVGDYATSYINTLNSAVTRGADAASKTGISSLIGTEFTLFYDGFESIGGDYNRYIALKGTGGTYANFIVFESNPNHKIAANVSNSSEGVVFSALSNTLTNGQRVKLALRCKNNSFAFYVNGSLVASQASGTVPTTSTLYLGYYVDYSDSYNLVNQSIIFPTGLTNAQMAEITTI